MNDERLRQAYTDGLPSGHDRPPLDDLAAERIRKLVDGEGAEAERLHTLDGLLATREGRADLDIVLAAARAARPRRRSFRTLGLAAAAILAIGIPSALWFGRERLEAVRGGEAPITIIAPRGGTVDRPERFVWRPRPDALRYTLIVVDTTGQDVFVSETVDTVVQLPDSVRLVPGASYLWWVLARTETGDVVTGLTERITVAHR